MKVMRFILAAVGRLRKRNREHRADLTCLIIIRRTLRLSSCQMHSVLLYGVDGATVRPRANKQKRLVPATSRANARLELAHQRKAAAR